MGKFKILVIRELWEHKNSILVTPLVIFVLVTLFSLLGFVSISIDDFEVKHQGIEYKQSFTALVHIFSTLPADQLATTLLGVHFGFASMFYFIMLLVLALYSLSALFDERKDRSVLFWKSMPVTDVETVLSKLFVACIVIPLSFWFFTVLSQVMWMVIAGTVAWFNDVSASQVIWGPISLTSIIFNELLSYLVNILWTLPAVGWALIAGAYAKRAPFFHAVLPLVIVTIVESTVFHSGAIFGWLGQRVLGMFIFTDGREVQFNMLEMFTNMRIDDVTHALNKLSNDQTWYGLVLGIVLIIISIKIRQRNDDAY
jgi:ABC-2 type transport system permease protein